MTRKIYSLWWFWLLNFSWIFRCFFFFFPPNTSTGSSQLGMIWGLLPTGSQVPVLQPVPDSTSPPPSRNVVCALLWIWHTPGFSTWHSPSLKKILTLAFLWPGALPTLTPVFPHPLPLWDTSWGRITRASQGTVSVNHWLPSEGGDAAQCGSFLLHFHWRCLPPPHASCTRTLMSGPLPDTRPSSVYVPLLSRWQLEVGLLIRLPSSIYNMYQYLFHTFTQPRHFKHLSLWCELYFKLHYDVWSISFLVCVKSMQRLPSSKDEASRGDAQGSLKHLLKGCRAGRSTPRDATHLENWSKIRKCQKDQYYIFLSKILLNFCSAEDPLKRAW